MADVKEAQLQDPDRRIAAIERAPVSQTGAQIVEAVGEGVTVAAETRKAHLGLDFANRLQEVSNETVGFDAEFRGIFDQLSGADSTKVKQLHARLGKLQRGEIQGVLSPASAKMKADALYRSAITAHPGLSGDFSRIRQATTFGVGGTANGISPEYAGYLKAEEKLASLQISTGLSRQTLVDYARHEAQAREAKAINDANLAAGTADFSSTLSTFSAQISSITLETQFNYMQMLEQDPEADATLLLDRVNNNYFALNQEINRMGTGSNALFTKGQRDELRAEAKASQEMMVSRINSGSFRGQMQRQAEIAKNVSASKYHTYLNTIGGVFPMLESSMTQANVFHMIDRVIPSMLSDVTRGGEGQIQILQEIVDGKFAAGDADAVASSMALEIIQKYPKLTAQQFTAYINDVRDGGEMPPMLHEYYAFVAGKAVRTLPSPGTDGESESSDPAISTWLDKAMSSPNANSVSDFLTPEYRAKMSGDPALAQQTKTVALNRLDLLSAGFEQFNDFVDAQGQPLSIIVDLDAVDNPIEERSRFLGVFDFESGTDFLDVEGGQGTKQIVTLSTPATKQVRNIQRTPGVGLVTGQGVRLGNTQIEKHLKKYNDLIALSRLSGASKEEIQKMLHEKLSIASLKGGVFFKGFDAPDAEEAVDPDEIVVEELEAPGKKQ